MQKHLLLADRGGKRGDEEIEAGWERSGVKGSGTWMRQWQVWQECLRHGVRGSVVRKTRFRFREQAA